MCRFIAYLGTPILMDEILLKPKNSLIKQSIGARESQEPLNGDGFGVGWYEHEIDITPAVFTSIQPAWNDRNLRNIAPKIKSSCIFAHIRAASVGGVSIFNCHPFHYNQFLFMHNGKVGGFNKMRRHLARELTDESFNWIKGQTDSEHVCALFLDIFTKNRCKSNADDIAAALRETIQWVENLMRKEGILEPSFMNIAITDGYSMVAVRHTSDPALHARTLYYSAGENFTFEGDACHLSPSIGPENKAVLIVSEKLTSYEADWHPIKNNYLLKVDKKFSLSLETL